MNRALRLVFGTSSTLIAFAACASFSARDATVADDAGAEAGSTSDSGVSADTGNTNTADTGGGEPDSSTTDDGGGGSTFSCSAFPSAFYCADFDEPTPTAFVGGMPLSLDVPVGNMIEAPSVSPSFAMWGGGSRVQFVSATSVTYAHASFQLRFESANKGSGGFARLAVTPQCYVSLTQDTDRIIVDSHCGFGGSDSYAYQPVTPALPAPNNWLPVELTLDLGQALASAKLGNASAMIPLNPSAKAGGLLEVDYGADFSANRVGIDNLIVDVK